MENKQIKVLIKNDGSISLETEGFKGPSCIEGVKNLLSSFLDIENKIETSSDYYDGEEEMILEVKNDL